jgi:hypothetical protein
MAISGGYKTKLPGGIDRCRPLAAICYIVDEFGYITQNRGRFKPFMPGSASTSSPRPERQKMEDIVASPPPVCYILIIGAPATIHDFQEVR